MSKIDPEIELFLKKEFELLHSELKNVYAIKLVEKIVFYAVGAASIAVLGAILKLVIL